MSRAGVAWAVVAVLAAGGCADDSPAANGIDPGPPDAGVDADPWHCPFGGAPVEIRSPWTDSAGVFSDPAVNVCGDDDFVAVVAVFWLAVPALSELELRNNWPAPFGLRASSCSASDLRCGLYHMAPFTDPPSGNDWYELTLFNVPAGTYFVVTKTSPGPGGGLALQVSGTIADGGACNSPLVAAGVLSCGEHSVCRAGVCALQNCGGLPAGTTCRDAAGPCDVAETCDGVGDTCPADDFVAAGTPCGDPSYAACDRPDTCDEAGGCQHNYQPATTICRPATGSCDVAELCDGFGSCPADSSQPGGTVFDVPVDCGAAGGCAAGGGRASLWLGLLALGLLDRRRARVLRWRRVLRPRPDLQGAAPSGATCSTFLECVTGECDNRYIPNTCGPVPECI